MKNKKPYNPYLISRVHRPWYTDGLYWTLIGLFAFVFLMGVIVGELLG